MGSPGGPSSSTPAPPASVDTVASTSGGAATTAAVAPAAPAEPYDSKKATGYVGLVNMGCTCYLNSLLQLLFHISYFRSAVFKISEGDSTDVSPARDRSGGAAPDAAGGAVAKKPSSAIPEALQELFYQMQERRTAPEPRMLTKAFKWTERELVVQHDIQELATLLRDNLEGKMKGTRAEGAIRRLFEGYGENVVETLDKSYVSRKKDVFYDIHLPLGKQFPTLYDSLRSLTAKDQLTGDNKYKVEEEGKPAVFKDAEMGYRFLKFPPVIFFHLKRFEMDMMSPTLEMKKVNAAMQFPTELDLREFENGDGSCVPSGGGGDEAELALTTDSQALYDLNGVIVHRGTVRAGHYYCYIRKFNQEAGRFEEWYEFDDDTVRAVPEADAVDENFGGLRYVNVNGYSQPFPKSHNAYILSYVRRADAAKIMKPTPTDLIPRHIVEKFKAVMVEDEKKRVEEERRNRLCNFVIFRDQHLAAYTARDMFELVSSKETKGVEPIMISLNKTAPFVTLFGQIKEQLKLDWANVRLWTWKHQGEGRTLYRPDSPLPTYNSVNASATVASICESLVHPDEQSKGWQIALYLEEKRVIPLPLVTNATMYELQSADHSALFAEHSQGARAAVMEGPALRLMSEPGIQPFVMLTLTRPMPIDVVTARLGNLKHRAFEMTITCALYTIDNQPVTQIQLTTRNQSDRRETPLSFTFNAQYTAQRVVLFRHSATATRTDPFVISKVHVHVPPSAMPGRQLSNAIGSAPIMPPLSSRTTLFFIKYYNYKSGTVSYLGAITADLTDPLRNCFPAIYHLMGLTKDDQQAEFPLLCFDESRPYGCKELEPLYGADKSENNLVCGNIIVVQRHPTKVPLIYRFPRYDQLVANIDNRVAVTVRNIAHPDVIAGVMLMQYNWEHASVVEAIGEKIGVDPERLRLYGNKDFVKPAPRDDPERSDSRRTLQQMLALGQWSTQELFYEVLDTTLRQLECLTHLDARMNNELGTEPTEKNKLEMAAEATVYDAVSEVLRAHGVAFDKPFVLMFIADCLIEHSIVVKPSDIDAEEPVLVKRVVPQRRCVAEVRPFTPPTPGHIQIHCGHADNTGINYRYLSTYGSPFLLNVPEDCDANDLQGIFMRRFNITEADVIEPGKYGVMFQTESLLHLPTWETTIAAYLKHTVNRSGRPSHLIFNHKRAKEKPGSRYVASNDPRLVIE